MIITCPSCSGRYRIDPSASKAKVAKVKCPSCAKVFEIPLAQELDATSQHPVAGTPVVLVVDDARFFREMIKDILQALPIELVLAADGNEALEKIVALQPKLVLLDLNIPGKSGKEILQSLSPSQRSQVKVLAMSGVERGDKTAVEVKAIGATDFISKSFKPSELQNRVKEILGL